MAKLTARETAILWEKYATGGMIKWLAQKHYERMLASRDTPVTFDDLYQTGLEVAHSALVNFDPDYKPRTKPSTYVWTAVNNYFRGYVSTEKLSGGIEVGKAFYREVWIPLAKAYARADNEPGVAQNPGAILAWVRQDPQLLQELRERNKRRGVTDEELRLHLEDGIVLLSQVGHIVEIDAVTEGLEDDEVWDMLDQDTLSPEDQYIGDENLARAREIVKETTTWDRAQVLIYSYGLDGLGVRDDKEISELMDKSRPAVRQQRKRGLDDLKKAEVSLR